MPVVRVRFVLAGAGPLSMVPVLDFRRDSLPKDDHRPRHFEAMQVSLRAPPYAHSPVDAVAEWCRVGHLV